MTLAYLRKESVDIYNRLHSIEEDIHFVHNVRAAYATFPIYPNLRCGAWYTDPDWNQEMDEVPVYFKSTDGHFNNWSFNLRRANMHLLPVLIKYGGVIVVDSTRTGKRMPDALSKTIPIWCAVINRAVRARYALDWDEEDAMGLYTPPGIVSAQEHDQIEERIDGWVASLVTSSFDIPALRVPLRPFWITPSTSTFPVLNGNKVAPVLCVSASKQVCEKSRGYTYIQGSGDDHELWGMGLEPSVFWKYKSALLDEDRSRLGSLVERIVVEAKKDGRGKVRVTPIRRVGGLVSIANGNTEEVLALSETDKKQVYILITSSGTTTATITDEDGRRRILHFTIAPGKKGQFGLLETVFPRSVEFVWQHVKGSGMMPRICCVCDSESGFDRCVGVAVVLLQVFFGDCSVVMVPERDEHTGCLDVDGITARPNKKGIQTRLEWIISSEPRANPSRTTMKRVNEYFMSSRRRSAS